MSSTWQESWKHMIAGLMGRGSRGRRTRRREPCRYLEVEALEERVVPSATKATTVAKPTGATTTTPAAIITAAISSAAYSEFYGANTTQKNGPLVKLGFDLVLTYEEYLAYEAGLSAHPTPHPAAFVSSDPLMPIDNGKVVINAIASKGNANSLSSSLQGLGIQVTGVDKNMVSALVPFTDLPAVAALSTLKAAEPADVKTNVVANSTQGNVAQLSNWVQNYFGFDGTGETVGVMSDSFDATGTNAAADEASGALPAASSITVDEEYSAGTDEGRAMMQIVHSVAPGANLEFATGYNGDADAANNIATMVSNSDSEIVGDITFIAEPWFQDGLIAQALESASVPVFWAAGDYGNSSYQANFNAGTVYGAGAFSSIAGAPAFGGGTAQNFATSGPPNSVQSLTIQSGATAEVELQWNQPYGSIDASGSTNEVDIYLIDATTNQVVAGSVNTTVGSDPIQFFTYTNSTYATAHNYNLMIVWNSSAGGSAPGLIKYIDYGYGITVNDYATNSSTVAGVANADNTTVMAVGAGYYQSSPGFGVTTPVLESYSSVGGTAAGSGTPILFDNSGNLLATPEYRQQPQIVGPDGVTTNVGVVNGGPGYSLFYGTSASVANVAGAAALILEADNTITPAELYSALTDTATPMLTPVPTASTGYGFINATDAMLWTSPDVFGYDATINLEGATLPTSLQNVSNSVRIVLSKNQTHLQIYDNSVLIFSGLTLGYDNSTLALDGITLNGGARGDTVTIDATNTDPLADVNFFDFSGNAAANNTVVGPNLTDYWDITGVNSGDFDNTPTDSFQTNTFENVQNLVGGSGTDTFDFSGTEDGGSYTGSITGKLNGGAGSNLLIPPDSGTSQLFYITGANQGNIPGVVPSFVNIQSLDGFGDTSNEFVFTGAGSLSGAINANWDGGSGGAGWLDYAGYAHSINVNLATGHDSTVAGGVKNINNILGSAIGGDTLVGNANGGIIVGHKAGNTITAGSGASLIIGGYGKNTLYGGGKAGGLGDILINGQTSYDNNLAALENILTNWTGNSSAAAGMAAVQASGTPLYINSTVVVYPPQRLTGPRYGRGGVLYGTTLEGGAGQDWYITSTTSSIVKIKAGDVYSV